jgi:hypothetical protein
LTGTSFGKICPLHCVNDDTGMFKMDNMTL